MYFFVGVVAQVIVQFWMAIEHLPTSFKLNVQWEKIAADLIKRHLI